LFHFYIGLSQCGSDAIAAHVRCEMRGSTIENRCNLLHRGKSFCAGTIVSTQFRRKSLPNRCRTGT
jgi:hypothetical protein